MTAGDRKIGNLFLCTDVFCTSKSKKIFLNILSISLPGSNVGELKIKKVIKKSNRAGGSGGQHAGAPVLYSHNEQHRLDREQERLDRL